MKLIIFESSFVDDIATNIFPIYQLIIFKIAFIVAVREFFNPKPMFLIKLKLAFI
mgnify:CR=1 FL=1